jgi:hypothetical protein
MNQHINMRNSTSCILLSLPVVGMLSSLAVAGGVAQPAADGGAHQHHPKQRKLARQPIWPNVHPLVAHCTEELRGVADALCSPEHLARISVKKTLHGSAEDRASLNYRCNTGTDTTCHRIIKLHASFFPAHKKLLRLIKVEVDPDNALGDCDDLLAQLLGKEGVVRISTHPGIKAERIAHAVPENVPGRLLTPRLQASLCHSTEPRRQAQRAL